MAITFRQDSSVRAEQNANLGLSTFSSFEGFIPKQPHCPQLHGSRVISLQGEFEEIGVADLRGVIEGFLHDSKNLSVYDMGDLGKQGRISTP